MVLFKKFLTKIKKKIFGGSIFNIWIYEINVKQIAIWNFEIETWNFEKNKMENWNLFGIYDLF